MGQIKTLFLILIILGGLSFLFLPPVFSNSLLSPEVLEVISKKEVIIIFNSGGWGDTPLQEAQDFAPVITGIEQTLNDWGYSSIIVPFQRTESGLLGKIADARDFFNSFSVSSESLAKDLEELAWKFPNKKIIVTGLSNGATFVTKTYEKVSNDVKDSIYVVSAGLPFWVESPETDNALQLTNGGKDSLAVGDAKSLFASLSQAPFKWFQKELGEQNLSIAKIGQISVGHFYSWENPAVSSQITAFLESKLR